MAVTLAQVQTFASWVGAHSNKVSSTARACYLAVMALGWSHLTIEQAGAIGLAAESILGLFIESTTVSKARMGERMEEKIAERAGTGTFKAPNVPNP